MASVREYRTNAGETTWRVLFRHGGRQTSQTFVTAKDAARFRSLVHSLGPDRAMKVLAEDDAAGSLTLGEVAAEFFDVKARDVQPRTLADYRRDYAKWIEPYFGHRTAALIDEADVQRWVDVDLRSLSAKTAGDRHNLLYGIFAWASAKSRAKVPRNPCAETELPKRVKSPPKGLTFAEWQALVLASYRVNLDAADLTLFLGSTGFRIGEATALTFSALEDAGERVWVTMHQVARKGEGIREGGKSLAAMRRIDVWGDCAVMLRRRALDRGPHDLVFTNAASPTGAWEPSTYRRRYWSKAVALAGLADRAPTPHWLRHTHVAVCLAAGMSLAEIQRRLGHTDIRTTINVYGRRQADTPDAVMRRMSEILGSGAAQLPPTP